MADSKPYVCSECGAEAIDSWPFVHCYKCGKREDRPDLGLNAKGQPLESDNETPTLKTPGGRR